jgi:TolB-like protein/Flp pilus assembly protein TadD
LESWKEIAAYLKREVRTVQRWEKEEGLPVRRHRHKTLGSVYAYKADLDAWWRNGQARLEQQEQAWALARQQRRPWLTVAAVVAGLAILVAAGYGLWQRFGPGAHRPERVMLAVLPLENLSGNPDQEYFSDGLSEEMITQLGRLHPERLGVIARTSASHYKGTNKRVDEIGRELGVDYILEGSVWRQAERVRINAQLIRVSDQTHLWAETYERDLRDVLALQNEVARNIANAIQLELNVEEEHRLARSAAVDPEAYDAYLKGRYHWNKRSDAGYTKAIEYFRQAIAREPNYPHAYAGLADAYALLGSISNDQISRSEAIARARAAALKALDLDDTLAEALTSLAFVRMHYDWDWTGAEKEFQRAIKLNPGYATAHHWYAYCLLALGRSEEALREIRRAEESDPLSLIIKTDVAEILYFGRHYDEAIAQARKAVEMDPNFFLAHRALGWALVQRAAYSEAIAELQEGLRLEPGRGDLLLYLAYAYARAGQVGEARRILARVKPAEASFEVVAVYVALGEKDAVFSWLEKGFKERSGLTVFLRTAPEYDPMRSDPRFADLLRRLGLQP